jgi:hypothetical protein
VRKLIGWLGIAWGQSNNRTWNAVGYPGKPNPPFPGNIMYELVGQYAPSSTSGVIGLTNDTMEEGSSGGPWIAKGPWSTNWPDTSPYHANGLQSYHLPASDTIEYSPYFTHEVHDLMKFLSDPANRK